MNAILFSMGTFVSTGIGGLFALKFNDQLHFILSFTAGVLLGVVSFEILPEIFRMAQVQHFSPIWGMGALLVGFLIFHALEKFVLVHHVHEADYAVHHHPGVGVLSASSLIGHSFMDGVGIGLGFQVSSSVGVLVAIAVISHDFCDGLNTVSLMLVNRNTARSALMMLFLDSIAPVLGAVLASHLHVPPFVLILYLGVFAGFLLYISASDILPEAHSGRNSAVTLALIALTCLGAALAFMVSMLA